jgi:myo-inositol-1(or 4)-monophosphatase
LPGVDLDLLTPAAHEAGKIASSFFRKSPQKWDKGDGQGPVTEADLAVNEMLERTLMEARPDYGWLSEETEDISDRATNQSIFIVDPIDGTRAFIEGSKSFSHSLAVARGGEVKAAVVHLPELGLTYAAEAGKGATLNGETIAHAPIETLETARVLSNKLNMKPEFWSGGVPPVERHFRSSLAYRLCLVADGQFHGMLTLRPTWEWDIAAGALIAAEAGATVTTQKGQSTRFNNSPPQLPGIIAAGPVLHDALLARL